LKSLYWTLQFCVVAFLSVAFEAAALPTIEWINRIAARALGFEEKI